MAGLKEQMSALCDDIRSSAMAAFMQEMNNKTPDSHSDIFHAMAHKYDLYENDQAPIWLSRIVEGIIRDVAQGDYVV